jgi:DNA-binding NarL/FixJ family response regulator
MSDPKIRMVLADDHGIVLEGLHRLFRQERDIEVVACCHSGEAALGALRRGGVDVLVIDLRMPVMTGLAVLHAIRAEGISCRTVLLTAAVSDAEAVEAMRLGATGLVLKESSPQSLIECVRHAHRGEQWVERQTMTRAFGRVLRQEAALRAASDLLTPRELEIACLIAQGHRNRAVAERLSISEGTVKIHLHNIYQKVGVDGRLELAVWVQQQELL